LSLSAAEAVPLLQSPVRGIFEQAVESRPKETCAGEDTRTTAGRETGGTYWVSAVAVAGDRLDVSAAVVKGQNDEGGEADGDHQAEKDQAIDDPQVDAASRVALILFLRVALILFLLVLWARQFAITHT